jgi:5'-nucleotidase
VRILLTNDDGVAAPGLAVLAGALTDLGATPRIAAPAVDQSGVGTAVGRLHARGPIPLESADVAGQPAIVVPGAPALAVLLDQLGAFGDPSDVVIAGVNAGANCGRWLVHSGTVGAALAAVANGAAGIALSLAPPLPGRPDFQWAAARAVSAVLVGALLADPPRGHAVNVNLPDLPLDRVRGWRSTSVAPGGASRPWARHSTEERSAISVHYGHWPEPFPRDTDSGAVHDGYVSVTWLGSVYGSAASAPAAAVAGLASALDAMLPDLPDGQDVRVPAGHPSTS